MTTSTKRNVSFIAPILIGVITNKDILIQRIQRDKKWWEVQMAKLWKFFFNALLPELACPRYRSAGIREPVDS